MGTPDPGSVSLLSVLTMLAAERPARRCWEVGGGGRGGGGRPGAAGWRWWRRWRWSEGARETMSPGDMWTDLQVDTGEGVFIVTSIKYTVNIKNTLLSTLIIQIVSFILTSQCYSQDFIIYHIKIYYSVFHLFGFNQIILHSRCTDVLKISFLNSD